MSWVSTLLACMSVVVKVVSSVDSVFSSLVVEKTQPDEEPVGTEPSLLSPEFLENGGYVMVVKKVVADGVWDSNTALTELLACRVVAENVISSVDTVFSSLVVGKTHPDGQPVGTLPSLLLSVFLEYGG